MNRLHCLALGLLMSVPLLAAPPRKAAALIDDIKTLVRQYFPEATISEHDGNLVAKYSTMNVTVRTRSKTGRSDDKMRQEEGPNYQGFLLVVSVQKGQVSGQADVPQTLHRPYWDTYIDRPATPDGFAHYFISFSYGAKLKPAFKQAMFDLLPKSNAKADEADGE